MLPSGVVGITFEGTNVSESLPTLVTGARFLSAQRIIAFLCVGSLKSDSDVPGGGWQNSSFPLTKSLRMNRAARASSGLPCPDRTYPRATEQILTNSEELHQKCETCLRMI